MQSSMKRAQRGEQEDEGEMTGDEANSARTLPSWPSWLLRPELSTRMKQTPQKTKQTKNWFIINNAEGWEPG